MTDLEKFLGFIVIIFALFNIIQSVLIYNTIPVSKVKELFAALREKTEETITPNDDMAVDIVETLWQWYLDSRTPKTPPTE